MTNPVAFPRYLCIASYFIMIYSHNNLHESFSSSSELKGRANMKSTKYQQELVHNYLTQAKFSLSEKPGGMLTICINSGRRQYYFRESLGSKKGVYISKKEQALIRALAQKDYDIKFIKTAEKLASRLDRLASKHAMLDIHYLYQELGLVYQKLSAPRKELVEPYVLPDDHFVLKWQSVNYQGNKFLEKDPWFYTDKKERVRSKSEVIIANILYKLGIPYRYEYPVLTKSLGTLYPDFFVLDLWNREEVIFEHFGRLDADNYRKRTKDKIEAYVQEGYTLGDGLIFTFEDIDSPLDMRYLTDLLMNRFPHVTFK